MAFYKASILLFTLCGISLGQQINSLIFLTSKTKVPVTSNSGATFPEIAKITAFFPLNSPHRNKEKEVVVADYHLKKDKLEL